MGEFNPQDVSNILWAFAVAVQPGPDMSLFVALAKVAERITGAFGAQHLANMA